MECWSAGSAIETRPPNWICWSRNPSVETEGECKATDRLGPYPSPEAAAHALESVKEREEQKEAEDRAWADGPAGNS